MEIRMSVFDSNPELARLLADQQYEAGPGADSELDWPERIANLPTGARPLRVHVLRGRLGLWRLVPR